MQPKPVQNPLIIMLSILFLAWLMSYFVPSGSYERQDKLVLPGSYKSIPKSPSPLDLISPAAKTVPAKPLSLMDLFTSIPDGIAKQISLIIMVLFIGGMFGVLNHTGAIEAGLERSLSLTGGRLYLLVPVLMLIFSCGSTFMGLAKEYLIIIPMVVALFARMGLSSLLALGVVAIAVKVGYLASITNPYALSIAQPLLGLPLFSGLSLRILTYVVMMFLGIAFMLFHILRARGVSVEFTPSPLSARHILILGTLGLGIIFLVFASQHWEWKNSQLSAYYLFLSFIFALIARIRPGTAAEAFVSGMKKVLIAALLIGLATAVELLLSRAKILDSIIFYLVELIGIHGPYASAFGMFFSQLLLDVAIPSTSGQAAVAMPILGPLGQLSGVSAQTTVLAFLMGNGLTNMITPTSSGLLIFLAAAQVGWGEWAKFIYPLVLIFALVALALLSLAVYINY